MSLLWKIGLYSVLQTLYGELGGGCYLLKNSVIQTVLEEGNREIIKC